MSDLATNVTWQEILREEMPHCRAIVAPVKWHNEIIEALAKKVLGSYRPTHPDLLVIGTSDKAARIGNSNTMTDEEYSNTTRGFIENIALKPMEASKRLGVVMCADKLLVAAANSLLKLAEEPPTHAYILFLMEDGRLFLPTLKSRSRYSVLISQEQTRSYKMPSNESEWLQWLARSRKAEVDSVINDLEAWANYALSQRQPNAPIIERLRIIASKKILAVPLLCDIIILTLKEGNIYECIFNDLW